MVQVFTALLIEKCNQTEGKVMDCDMVLEASRAYQERRFLGTIKKEKIAKGNSDDRIKKTDIRTEFNEWYPQNYGKKGQPAAKELYEYLDKTQVNTEKEVGGVIKLFMIIMM